MALSALAEEMLEDLPPFLHGSRDIQSVLDVLARELERVEAATETLRENFYPQSADAYLRVWEALLGLAIDPPDKTLEQRRTSVMAFMQSLKGAASGRSWEENMTALIGTNWSYQEHQPGVAIGINNPPAYTLRITIPFGSPLPAPTGLGTTTSTTGGTLAAGTYYYVVTAINQYGETISSSEVSRVTTGATSRVTVSWTAVPDATGYRVYRSTSSGHERLVTTVLGQATVSYIDTGTATTAAAPPTVNSTSSPQAYEAEALARQITPAHIDLIFGYGVGFILGTSQVGEEPL